MEPSFASPQAGFKRPRSPDAPSHSSQQSKTEMASKEDLAVLLETLNRANVLLAAAERDRCADAPILAVVANPKTLGAPMLDLDSDVTRLIDGLDNRIRIEHAPTAKSLQVLVERLRPRVLMFHGHALAQQGFFARSNNGTPEYITWDTLAEIVVTTPSLRVVTFAACHTDGLRAALEKRTLERRVLLVTWSTIVEDAFAKSFTEKLVHILGSIDVERASHEELMKHCHDRIGRWRAEQDEKGAIGDPQTSMQEGFDTHLDAYVQLCREREGGAQGAVRLRTLPHISQFISGCAHCTSSTRVRGNLIYGFVGPEGASRPGSPFPTVTL